MFAKSPCPNEPKAKILQNLRYFCRQGIEALAYKQCKIGCIQTILMYLHFEN